jgi:hypothetical protein
MMAGAALGALEPRVKLGIRLSIRWALNEQSRRGLQYRDILGKARIEYYTFIIRQA